MKNLLIAALTLVSVSAFAQTYKVDTAKTKLVWVGKKVTGQHTGAVSAKSGNLVFKGEELVGGEVIVDMNTITCTDITDAKTNGDFLGHIKSPDFYDVAKHPEAKLVIKSAKKSGKNYAVVADLTIKGKTAPVNFSLEVVKSDKTVSGKTKLVFDRTVWDIRYGSGKFFKGLGDKVIHDEIEVSVDVTAAQ